MVDYVLTFSLDDFSQNRPFHLDFVQGAEGERATFDRARELHHVGFFEINFHSGLTERR
ncbi:hypothetical protein AGR2A_Cc130035 [Agrobacterium genomosp. 2 str. CFBP 5494]|uniref:Uncharacterized protein n=1 Tax=Agrobacterium genomosp. 2 str. CFBP 5494 TaxID=1183436 RepID=A0A9W5AZR7_9HYPH|nr:hypothetical protein AGR2A_Cc130035 [Agrobacterium genomosp. 2 str. CFBP 5494]